MNLLKYLVDLAKIKPTNSPDSLEFMHNFAEIIVRYFDNSDLPLYEKLKLIKPEQPLFKYGDRVLANQTSGFHKGAKGVVQFVEPGISNKVWVLRDGASTAVFFYTQELNLIHE